MNSKNIDAIAAKPAIRGFSSVSSSTTTNAPRNGQNHRAGSVGVLCCMHGVNEHFLFLLLFSVKSASRCIGVFALSRRPPLKHHRTFLHFSAGLARLREGAGLACAADKTFRP